MAYVALYRRWRPQDFDTLVGQQAVKTALSNALASGRIAHAYLFAGPRGTGKTSTARILAKALNCEQGPTAHPCGVCTNCERITAGTSMDVFEIDAASNRGIEEIKTLREQLAFAPVNGRYKVYIIDEVHMLTTEAFNALLKTLEEPPAHVIFILATTDPHKIPATIHSRCQRFDFRRVTVEEITEHLAMVAQKSDILADVDALRLIAIQSEGGMRDALSLLDQCGVMTRHITAATVREVLGIVGRETLRELVQAIGRQDLSATLAKLNFLLEQGKDVRQVLTEVAEYLRALLLFKAAPSYQEVYLTDTAEALSESAPLFTNDRLMAAEERLHSALGELRWTVRPRITAELCLFDLCRQEGSTLAALAMRVAELEKRFADGVTIRYAEPPSQFEQSVPKRNALSQDEQSVSKSQAPSENGEQASKMKASLPNLEAATKTEPKSAVKPQASQPKTLASALTDLPKAQAQVVEVEEYGGDFATGEEYWSKALEILAAEKKIAMVSCARGGKVISYHNGVLRVGFKAAFQCDRMNKEDYRKVFEDVLLRIARQSIRLECVVPGTAKPVAKAQAKKEEAALPQADLENVPEAVKKAHNVFGGTLHEL
ncbi:MAG: DNA polymerase III subunit gamma/tau [Phascolarctobacterium sp.]|nr:DNA polymerase III subunit gamma/tau [Phascolarctobacterium sp.]